MRIIVLLAAILSFAASSALAQSASTTATPTTAPAEPRVELAAFPQPGKLTYAVMRDGNKIGSQVVEFQRNGDQLLVLTSVKIEVSLLGITIYRFVHRSEEEWKGGELARLTSNTDDDGDKRVVDLKLVDGKLKGQYNGQAKEFPHGHDPRHLLASGLDEADHAAGSGQSPQPPDHRQGSRNRDDHRSGQENRGPSLFGRPARSSARSGTDPTAGCKNCNSKVKTAPMSSWS